MTSEKVIIKAVFDIEYVGHNQTPKINFNGEVIGEKYERLIHFTAWKDKAQDIADSLTIGTECEVFFNVKSREYNGKFYTDVEAWKWNVTKEGEPRSERKQEQQNDYGDVNDDLPF